MDDIICYNMVKFRKAEGFITKIRIILLAVLLLTSVSLLFMLVCFHDWQPAVCDAPQTCLKCGKTQGESLGHTWQDATCETPQTCSLCGQTQGAPLSHRWQDATCTAPETCSDCGLTQGVALEHNWQGGSCTQPGSCELCGQESDENTCHSWREALCAAPQTCILCGQTQGVPLGHSFHPATCAAPETCDICGMTQGTVLAHSWQPATCLTPETCAACGMTQGESSDHDWVNQCGQKKTCATCGKAEGKVLNHNWSSATCAAPKTCTVCKKTEGKALAHSWTDATCTTPKTCTECGKTSGNALGHTFEDNQEATDQLCTVCGRSVSLKYVALTFDDGPSGEISLELLDALDRRGVKSTFFVCGYRVKLYPDLPQEVIDRGHELALHTSTHANLTQLSAAQIRKELQDTIDLLPEDCEITLMRPPGGNYNSTVRSVCADMGLSVMLWSLDTRDWETNDVDAVVEKIVNNVKDGDIILMHELKYSSVKAALKAIDILQAQGYVFVTVSQLAEIQGKTLVPGDVYTSLR